MHRLQREDDCMIKDENKKSKDSIFQEDIRNVAKAEFIPWDMLAGKTLFITGATGLIGATVINALNYASKVKQLNLKLLALVRDRNRAEERFRDILGDGVLSFAVGSVEQLPDIDIPIDYIIHGASQTASREFVSHPVETLETTLLGTMNLLKLAKEKKVSGFVYLSSMEVYGYPEKGHKVKENEIGSFAPMNLRNCYPIGKIASENLCCSYASEYPLPAMSIRLTQTFGAGVNYNDTRVFAYFARCVKEQADIVLKTKGETERCYLYTTDAATAILTVLLNGKPGKIYNAADEATYCSIAEMAEKVAENGGIKVVYDIQDAAANGFPDTLYMDLDTSELKKLGWCPLGVGHTIIQMYSRMIADM